MLYSVFTDDIINNIDLIEKIKYFLQKQYPIIDFVIFTDDITYGTNDSCVLTTFYMIAYRGIVIFLNINDYLSYKDKINGGAILYLTKNDIPDIDQNFIKNCGILTDTNNELEWIKQL